MFLHSRHLRLKFKVVTDAETQFPTNSEWFASYAVGAVLLHEWGEPVSDEQAS